MTAEMAPLTQARRHWQTPQLRTDEEEDRERKTSWLELFYDLVFVTLMVTEYSWTSGRDGLLPNRGQADETPERGSMEKT